MPRCKVIDGKSLFYKGYDLNVSYRYDEKQLSKILNALEGYHELSKTDSFSNYVAFEVTLNVDETLKSPFFDPLYYDDPCNELELFNINNLKSVFPSDSYFYLWTREFKTEYCTGEHYHLMVIANHMSKTELFNKRDELENLTGVKSAFIAPRVLDKNDPRTHKVYFHFLRESVGADGIRDAFSRYCYNAKIDQKIESFNRSFDGCRKLSPLNVISKRHATLFKSKLREKELNDLDKELNAFEVEWSKAA